MAVFLCRVTATVPNIAGPMEILALKNYSAGYRGCLVDADGYHFFQLARKGRLRWLKSYPASAFSDHYHFIAMMQKFMTPSAFLVPPVPIKELSIEELERVQALKKTDDRRRLG